jgi:hypothetical protein
LSPEKKKRYPFKTDGENHTIRTYGFPYVLKNRKYMKDMKLKRDLEKQWNRIEWNEIK